MKNVNPAVLTFAALLALGPVATQASTTEEKKETKKVEMKETKATEQKEEHKTTTSSSDAAMLKEAKITMDQARATALKAAPGKVESGEIEREHGKLIYSFDIRNAKGTIDEVNVNAIDGKIVAVEHENKTKEAAEKKQEAKEHKTTTTKTTTKTKH
ncbi:MAG TPA: PepSY domain-containing protein [Thermoanaerobaculia bacterium]|nr:PepSY domain-containing protein [Thermoanaerobaculia bacterium]